MSVTNPAPLPERAKRFIAQGAPEGQRADEAFYTACQLRDAGYSESDAITKVLEGAAACGLPPDEARHAVKEAYKRPPREPVRHKGNGSAPPKSNRKQAATYDYVDENGKLLFQCVRYTPKGFAQRRPDCAGGWKWNLDGVRRVPYHLPEVIKASEVWICEGEKDANTATALGFIATTNPCGAGNWRDDYNQFFTGKFVIICGDNDTKGREHIQQVARSLNGIATRVCVVELPEAVKDISDFVPTLQSRDQAAAALRALADSAPDWKPVQAVDIKAGIIAILTDGKLMPRQRNEAVAGLVVDALTERGRFYFHRQYNDFATAMYFDGETKHLRHVQADAFLGWLSEWTGINRSAHLFKFIQTAVENASLSGPHTRGIIPESFWASRPMALYLSNGDGQLVKITGSGYALADNGTDDVVFGSGATLAPWMLTEPVDPFTSCAMFRDANFDDPRSVMLLKLWSLSFATSPPCKPPLVTSGPVRSGKTRVLCGLDILYGLPEVVEQPVEKEKSYEQYWVNQNAGGLHILDNADTRVSWLADAIASASTGGGIFPRKLYTNSGRVALRANSWLAVTTCNATFASDAGSADRLLVARMHRRTGETSEQSLNREIVANRNSGLSWIAHILSKALADIGPVPAGLNHRHPDFAAFAVRLGRAMGQEAEAIAALQAAEADKARFCLENDTVGAVLLHMIAAGKSFVGTSAQLLPVLAACDSEFSPNATGPGGHALWSTKRLGKRLVALWPYVEEMADAKQEKDRNHYTVFSFKPRPAESAEFKTLKPVNSPARENIESLPESTQETPQTPQPTPAAPQPQESGDELI